MKWVMCLVLVFALWVLLFWSLGVDVLISGLLVGR